VKQIQQPHCQQCASTDVEDVGWDALSDNDGYSACCNELVVYPSDDVFGRPWVCGSQCLHE
jgi:hypothetical protein